MIRYFSPEALSEISRNIGKSLTDTFQMMFQLDISLLAGMRKDEDGRTVVAYMELICQGSKSYLTMSISQTSIKQIAHSIGGGEGHRDEMLQDIVCEITNIVGNHLRAYIAEKWGTEFELRLPQPGAPPASDGDMHILNMHFRIRETGNLDLDFSYAPATAA